MDEIVSADSKATPAQIEPPIAVRPHRRQSMLGEMWAFLRVRKKLWLAPIIFVLVMLSILMYLAMSAGVISPFVYAL